MQTKNEVLEQVRTMFRQVLAASAAGGGSRVLRARGCVDGYMRALLDLDIASRAELLDVIRAERERADGPPLGTLEGDDAEGVAPPGRVLASTVAA